LILQLNEGLSFRSRHTNNRSLPRVQVRRAFVLAEAPSSDDGDIVYHRTDGCLIAASRPPAPVNAEAISLSRQIVLTSEQIAIIKEYALELARSERQEWLGEPFEP
jgi:hypothetical protein